MWKVITHIGPIWQARITLGLAWCLLGGLLVFLYFPGGVDESVLQSDVSTVEQQNEEESDYVDLIQSRSSQIEALEKTLTEDPADLDVIRKNIEKLKKAIEGYRDKYQGGVSE